MTSRSGNETPRAMHQIPQANSERKVGVGGKTGVSLVGLVGDKNDPSRSDTFTKIN